MQKLTLNFSANHPTAAGHFSGNPIIPGALLLAEVMQLIIHTAGINMSECTVQTAKFLHPVRPGDSVDITYQISEKNIISFKCTVNEISVLSGGISATVAH
jgi:3-hydroxymyristoyl/3-hydroxydecanoyl-(acyl carrier protein) dehydratase